MRNLRLAKIRFFIIVFVSLCTISFFTAGKIQPNYSKGNLDTLKLIEPDVKYQIEDQLITSLLTRYHFKKFNINDSLSNIIYDRYINSLDHGKNYFLSEDIKAFDMYKNRLDDNLISGDVQFYYDVFNMYLKRLNQRMGFIDSLLDNEFDYSVDENYEFNQ